MREQVEMECSECQGIGTIEDRRGSISVCNSCKGKGTVYEPGKSRTKESQKV